MLTQADIRAALIQELAESGRGSSFAAVFVEIDGKKVEIPTLRATVIGGKSDGGDQFAYVEFRACKDLYKVEDGKATVHTVTKGNYRDVEDALLPEPEDVKALRKQIEAIQVPKGYRLEPNGKGGFDVVKAITTGTAKPQRSGTRATRERKGGFSSTDVGKGVVEMDKDGQEKGKHTIKSVDAEGNATLSNGKAIPNYNRYYKRSG